MTNATFSAGYNHPGCLPDAEPQVFDSFDEAKRFLIHEAKWNEDISECEDVATDWCHFAEDVNLWSRPGYALAPDGSEWWIHEG